MSRMIGKIVERGLREYGGPFPAEVELSWSCLSGEVLVHGVRSSDLTFIDRATGKTERQYEVLMDLPAVPAGYTGMPARVELEEAGPPGAPAKMRAWVHENDILVFGSLHFRKWLESDR